MYNPTLLFFGKSVLRKLNTVIDKDIKKVLFLYGGGSIKNNGVYDEVVSQLKANEIDFIEFSGIKSNPIAEDANEALKLVRKNKLQAIVAVGGGSVIDTAKFIAGAALYENDVWDLITGNLVPNKTIPIYSVLTLAATGTEMNNFAVLQSKKHGIKASFASPLTYPKASFLDPTYTLSVPKDYTAFGLVDIVAHCLEAFFGKGESELADKITTSIIKETVEIGAELLNNLNDYGLRARMMYASTMALNGTTVHGKKFGDWGVHSIGHVLSFEFNVPHGASLSIAYPAWLKFNKEICRDKISKLGTLVFGISDVNKIIECFENLFEKWESPIRISQLNLKNYSENLLLESMKKAKVNGYNYVFDEKDYPTIIDLMKGIEKL